MTMSNPTRDGTTPLLIDPELGDRQAFHAPDALMMQQEQSPAYRALQEAGLIVNIYRIRSAEDLDLVHGSVTVASNFARRSLAYLAGALVGGIVYDSVVAQFTVKGGHVRPAQHTDGSYFFYGPGVHRVMKVFLTFGTEVCLASEQKIEHGTRTIVTVPQGFVGLAFDRGQPILLAPGLHQWNSETLRLKQLIDMSEDVITIGPFTLITVDEGYAAITQDNGKQRVLNGGAVHMLTHRNWKFEKLISLKIHTDDLGPFRATTADNVVLETSAMVTWRVVDPTLAARMAADTMVSDDQTERLTQAQAGTSKRSSPAGCGAGSSLRKDVMKQAVASLAATLGSIRYADDVHVAASDKVTVVDKATVNKDDFLNFSPSPTVGAQQAAGVSEIFSVQQMSTSVQHANEICSQYGVSIIAINVNSAIPIDKSLEEALSAGAVAAAGAQQAEIASRGNAKARLINSQSEAEAARITAQAAADAERLHAQGKKDAAELLQTSEVAVELARLEKCGSVIGPRTTFMFGANASQVPSLMANPKLLSDAAGAA